MMCVIVIEYEFMYVIHPLHLLTFSVYYTWHCERQSYINKCERVLLQKLSKFLHRLFLFPQLYE